MTASEMTAAVLDQHVSEEARVRALEDLDVLRAGQEERFDRITRLARQVFGVAGAAVTLIDRSTQHHKSQAGTPLSAVPRADAFCDHTIRGPEVLVVEDAAQDPRFAQNPTVVGDPRIRFYAGHPLEAPGGHRVGALCLIDDRPRSFDETERATLAELAALVQRELVRAEELERAAEVQRALLPYGTPRVDGYDLAGLCLPSGGVGGDFYDWYRAPDDDLVLTLGDVMGKGMQAALMMATVRAVVRSTGRTAAPAAAVAEAAQVLHEDLQRTDMLVTLCHARLHPDRAVLDFTDAGHGLMVVVRADGVAQRPPAGGLPLGWVADDAWPQVSVRMGRGDTVVAFSDGLLELYDGTLGAVDEVVSLVRRATCADEVTRHVAALAGRVDPLDDDVTVLVIRRTG